MESFIWIFVALIIIIYMVIVPVLNQKKVKQDQLRMKEFQARLNVNDEIVMFNGIHGKVKELHEDTALVEIAPEVVIQVERTAIVGVKH